MKNDMDTSSLQGTPVRGNNPVGQLMDAPWTLRTLLLLALLVPLGFAGWFMWHERAIALHEVHASAQRSVVALVEHSDSVLEVHSLVLRQVANLTAGKTWREIAADTRLQQSIRDLTAHFDQISVIGMADANGRLWVNSAGAVSESTTVVDRDYFIAHQSAGHRGMYFSQAFTGRLSGKRQFAVSIARTNANGDFDGIIYTAVPLDFLMNFWKRFVPSGGYLIPMIRDDGTLIVRYPAQDNPERLDPKGPFVTHVRKAPRGIYTAVSQVDGIERINAYSQIRNYPLYISYSVEKDVAMQKWQQASVIVFGVAAAVSAALVTLLVFAIRQSRGQRLAIEKWRDVADNLKREVTRRQEAEAALSHAQKMEALGQITGGIAHDFNNLLAGISGNLELMRIRLLGGHGDVGHHIDAAEAVVDRAVAVTQRLLAFSRRQALSPKPVNVNDRVIFMRELLEQTIGPAIHLQITLADDLWNTLCDVNQLDSALLNLAINARDAMPAGGQLTITTMNVPLARHDDATARGAPTGKYVAIIVADTGVGMPPEVRERAFDPFFTTKPIGQGTGLGLSMVYGFIKQSGGEISIDSTVNAGTAVRLYLPSFGGAAGRDPQPSARTVAPRPACKASIMLVDDEEALRSVLAETLADMGCTVFPAEDGAAALNIIESTAEIDLLITDLGLPGAMDGSALATAAKAHRPDLKIMFITGYNRQQSDAGDSPVHDAEVLNKPFKLDDFVRKVSSVLESQSR